MVPILGNQEIRAWKSPPGRRLPSNLDLAAPCLPFHDIPLQEVSRLRVGVLFLKSQVGELVHQGTEMGEDLPPGFRVLNGGKKNRARFAWFSGLGQLRRARQSGFESPVLWHRGEKDKKKEDHSCSDYWLPCPVRR